MNAVELVAVVAACMLAIYAIGVQYERGGAWKLVFPVTLLALLMSWALNQTLGRLLYGTPASWRETFSKHTERTTHLMSWRGRVARLMAAVLNFFSHDELHIER